ncbi:MAG TPA: CNNM domain-containing protein [Pseudomonadales bacterium]|nr:CNNM domain-containing protein [Pseudomonadales bacterium]
MGPLFSRLLAATIRGPMISLLVLFLLISLVFSFLCSLWEAVLLSITPSYAQGRLQAGAPIGRHLQNFKENIDRPLAAILTLNTVAHTVGAIGVGAQATRLWADTNPMVTTLLVPAAMTLAILILSEIVPKTLGATHWRAFAPFTVRSLRILIVLLAPLVWLAQLVTVTLKHGGSAPVLTRTDFMAMAELGAREGVFEEGERRMISSLMQFARVQVRDVMTPRTVVTAVAEEEPLENWFAHQRGRRFSRIPTFHQGTKDQITGYVLKDELLEALAENRRDEPVGDFRRDIVTVGETHPITELFRTLTDRQEHIALILDDFGGMAGIVTMEDMIETLLGMEIVDETDGAADMRILARRHRMRRARALGLIEQAPPPSGDADDGVPPGTEEDRPPG